MTATEGTARTSGIEPVRKLEVKQSEELAKFYKIPQSLVNMMVVDFGGAIYPKEAFLLEVGHRKGIQRIDVDKPTNTDGEWTTEARIFPRVTASMVEAIAKLPDDQRKEAWAYVTAPVRESGRASAKNVRMSTMQEWLPEIAIKRAVCRALRLFAGVGTTSFEELPEVIVDQKDLQEVKARVIQEDPPLGQPATSTPTKPTRKQPATPVSPRQSTPASTWTDTTT